MLACGVVGIFGLICLGLLFSRKRRVWHGLVFAASLPFSWLCVSFLITLHTQHQQHSGDEFVFTLPPMAREYAQLHPDRIHRIASDEECVLEGFTDWFRDTIAERKRDWPDIIKIFSYRDGKILDPQGVPVAYACDFNFDGVIDFRGEHFQVIPRGDRVGYDFKLAIIWHPNRSDEHVPILFY